ncbi:aspartate aminotransferase family protein [Anaerobacillus arseniciselenatis]|uniref:Aspartate aminotransferase family protein n=1 Tax=Anaerobacillus arseniciselenatis TaxID=85682 RepID=A0A1S2LLK1_9BACI|nr:aspartate aminotransferase family protein [Anaerobacillus arseniciselenatis]OIJ12973.1 aspartate aminotransferase family protein [Anaerobacillus arseniciselenatis]
MQQSYLIKPVLDIEYPTIDYGKGVYLYDKNNKDYIDGSSGAVTASVGHGVTEVINAMTEQANKVSFVYRSQFTSEAAEGLAKKLSEITPGDLNWSFFVNSGSEATETAMKVAIQHWQEQGIYSKTKVLSRWMSYHGITLGALSMSGHVARRERFVALLDDLPSASAPYCYRCPFGQTHPRCQLLCAKELERAIKRIGKDSIAAFIAEPIIGAAAGAVVPPEGYYAEIKAICERNNILFIADEVMTGMGRTGKMLAIEHWGVQPDIVALGKGMSGGYTPIAAALVSDKVMEPILQGSKMIMSGHTFSANPQSAAASLAVLNYIEKHHLVDRSEKIGNYLRKELIEVANRTSIIGDVRGKGLMLGIEFVENKNTKQSFAPQVKIANRVIKKAMENGLLVYPANAGDEGITGDAILVAPPLVITKEEIDELIFRFKKSIEEVEKDLLHDGQSFIA